MKDEPDQKTLADCRREMRLDLVREFLAVKDHGPEDGAILVGIDKLARICSEEGEVDLAVCVILLFGFFVEGRTEAAAGMLTHLAAGAPIGPDVLAPEQLDALLAIQQAILDPFSTDKDRIRASAILDRVFGPLIDASLPLERMKDERGRMNGGPHVTI